ncbi:MAG: Crp/Fnr family transcriptional regulator [Cyanophyceae cyanobacterium]
MQLSNFQSLPSFLQNATTSYSFAADQILFRQGDRSRNVLIVTNGRIKLVRSTIEGRTVVLQVVNRGESLGENTFLSDFSPYTAIAEVPSRAIAFPPALLREALHQHPELAADFRERLLKKIQALEVRLELLQIRAAHQRLLQYLRYQAAAARNQTVVVNQPLKTVAAELYLSPRTVSRALARLEQNRQISRQADAIILLD